MVIEYQDSQLSAQGKAQLKVGLFLSEKLNIKAGIRSLIDLVYPPRCLHCGRVDYAWCPDCIRLLIEADIAPTSLHVDGLDRSIALTQYASIYRDAVQALKYHGALNVAPILSQKLTQGLKEASLIFDIIIPVPIHTTRFAKRRYNQSMELSLAIREQLKKPIHDQALIRSKQTRAQVGLNQQERLQNIKDAFVAEPAEVVGKRILLVDDVQTTGATLAECANSLRTAGAASVIAITVCYADGSQ